MLNFWNEFDLPSGTLLLIGNTPVIFYLQIYVMNVHSKFYDKERTETKVLKSRIYGKTIKVLLITGKDATK